MCVIVLLAVGGDADLWYPCQGIVLELVSADTLGYSHTGGLLVLEYVPDYLDLGVSTCISTCCSIVVLSLRVSFPPSLFVLVVTLVLDCRVGTCVGEIKARVALDPCVVGGGIPPVLDLADVHEGNGILTGDYLSLLTTIAKLVLRLE